MAKVCRRDEAVTKRRFRSFSLDASVGDSKSSHSTAVGGSKKRTRLQRLVDLYRTTILYVLVPLGLLPVLSVTLRVFDCGGNDQQIVANAFETGDASELDSANLIAEAFGGSQFCWQGQHLLVVILATFQAPIMLTLTLVQMLTMFDRRLDSSSLFVRFFGRSDMIDFAFGITNSVILSLMVGTAPKWLVVLGVTSTVVGAAYLQYKSMPQVRPLMDDLNTALLCCTAWQCLVAIMSLFLAGDADMSLFVLLGLLPAGTFGFFLVRSRRSRIISSRLSELTSEADIANWGHNRFTRAHALANSGVFSAVASVSHKDMFGIKSTHNEAGSYSEQTSLLAVTGLESASETREKLQELLQQAETAYTLLSTKYSKSAHAAMLAAMFYRSSLVRKSHYMELRLLARAWRLSAAWDIRLEVLLRLGRLLAGGGQGRNSGIDDDGAGDRPGLSTGWSGGFGGGGSGARSHLDDAGVVGVVGALDDSGTRRLRFEAHQTAAAVAQRSTSRAMVRLWNRALAPKTDVALLHEHAVSVQRHRLKLEMHLKSMVTLNPTSSSILRLYAAFCLKFLHDEVIADVLLGQAEKLESIASLHHGDAQVAYIVPFSRMETSNAKTANAHAIAVARVAATLATVGAISLSSSGAVGEDSMAAALRALGLQGAAGGNSLIIDDHTGVMLLSGSEFDFGRIITVNAAAAAMLQAPSKDEIEGSNMLHWLPPPYAGVKDTALHMLASQWADGLLNRWFVALLVSFNDTLVPVRALVQETAPASSGACDPRFTLVFQPLSVSEVEGLGLVAVGGDGSLTLLHADMPLNLLLGVCEEGDIPPEQGTPLLNILQPRLPEGKQRSSRGANGEAGGPQDAFTGAPFPDGTREMAMQVVYEALDGQQGGNLDVSVHFTPLSVPLALLPHSSDPASASGIHVNEAITWLARRPAPRRRRSSAASSSAHSSAQDTNAPGGFVAAVGSEGIAGYAILRLSVVEESTSSAAAAARRAVRDISGSPRSNALTARNLAASKRASALRDHTSGSGRGGGPAATRNLTPWGTNNAFKTMRKTPSFASSTMGSARSDMDRGGGSSSARGAGHRAAAACPPRGMVRAASSGSAASGNGPLNTTPRGSNTALHVMTGTGTGAAGGRPGAPPRPVFTPQGVGVGTPGAGGRTRMMRASSLPSAASPASAMRDGTADSTIAGSPLGGGGVGSTPPPRRQGRRVSVAAAVLSNTPWADSGSLGDLNAAAAAGDISHRAGGMSSAPRGSAVAPSSHTPGGVQAPPLAMQHMIDDTGDAGIAVQGGSASPARRGAASGASVVHKKLMSMAASRRSLLSAGGTTSRMQPGIGHALLQAQSRSRRSLNESSLGQGDDGSEGSGGSSNLGNNLRILRKLVDQSSPTSLPPIRWIRLSYLLFGALLLATFLIGLVFAGAAVSAERQFLPSLLSHGVLGYTYAHLHSVLWAAIQPVDSIVPRQPGAVYVQELVAQRAALNFNTRDIVALELGSVHDAGPLVTVLQAVNSIPSVLDRITQPGFVNMFDVGLRVRRSVEGGSLPSSQYDLWQATLQELLFLEGQTNTSSVVVNGSSIINMSPLALGAFSPSHVRTAALLDNLVLVALPASNATTTYKTQFWGWVLDLSFWYQLLTVSMVFLAVVFVLQFYYTSFASSALARIRDEPLLALRSMKRETLRLLKTDANLLALGGFDALVAAAHEREVAQQGPVSRIEANTWREDTFPGSADQDMHRGASSMHKSVTSAMPLTPPSDGPSFFGAPGTESAVLYKSQAPQSAMPGQNPQHAGTHRRGDMQSSNPRASRSPPAQSEEAATNLHTQKSFRARVPFSAGDHSNTAAHVAASMQPPIAEASMAPSGRTASGGGSVDGEDETAVAVSGITEDDLLGIGTEEGTRGTARHRSAVVQLPGAAGVVSGLRAGPSDSDFGAQTHRDSATGSSLEAGGDLEGALISGAVSEDASAATGNEGSVLITGGQQATPQSTDSSILPRDLTPDHVQDAPSAHGGNTMGGHAPPLDPADDLEGALIPAATVQPHAGDMLPVEELEPADEGVSMSLQMEALGIEGGGEEGVARLQPGAEGGVGRGQQDSLGQHSRQHGSESKQGHPVHVERQASDASQKSVDLMDLLRAGPPPKKAPRPPPKQNPASPVARTVRQDSGASLDLMDLLRAGPPAKRNQTPKIGTDGAAAGAAAGASPAVNRRTLGRSNTKRFEGLAAAGGNRRAARHAIRSVAVAAKGSGGGAGGGAKRNNRRKNVTARFKSITNIAALAPMLSLVLFMVLFWPLWGEAHQQSTRHGSSIYAAMQGAVHSTLFTQSLKEATVESNTTRRSQLVDRALNVHAADVRFRVSSMQQAGRSDLWTRQDAVFDGSLNAAPNSPITDDTIKEYKAGETPFEILNEDGCVAGGAPAALAEGILTGPMATTHIGTCSQYENGLLAAGLSDAVSRLLSVGSSVGFALRQGPAAVAGNSTSASALQSTLQENLRFVIDTEEGHIRHAMVGLAYASLTEGLLELDRLYAAMVGVSIGVALTALALMVLVLWPRVMRVGHLALAARSVLVLIPPAVLQQTADLRNLVHHLTATGSTTEDNINRTSSSASEQGKGGWRSGPGRSTAASDRSANMNRAKSMRQFMANSAK